MPDAIMILSTTSKWSATSDKTYYVKHDERWRIVAVFRESDTSAKEAFVYHNAGASGHGGSSYIDDVILRDRDHNSGWTSAADGTLEQRRYYCQNWRHDVVALIKSDGKIAERDRYLSYGTPFGSPLADATFDGTVSASDTTQVNNDWGANYHVRSDFNLDGAVGAADSAEVTANSGKSLGWGTLSDMTNVGNRKGYAGYEIDIAVSKLHDVRYRAVNTELGRWQSRELSLPSTCDIHGSCNHYGYSTDSPVDGVDPLGLTVIPIFVPYPLPNPFLGYCCYACTAWVPPPGGAIPAWSIPSGARAFIPTGPPPLCPIPICACESTWCTWGWTRTCPGDILGLCSLGPQLACTHECVWTVPAPPTWPWGCGAACGPLAPGPACPPPAVVPGPPSCAL